MFERRLKLILASFLLVFAVLVVRLMDLQVVHARTYRAQAVRVLLRPAKTLPFVRGRIVDRSGEVLAGDEPCWEVKVDFDVLAGEASREDGKDPRSILSMWIDLASFSGEPMESLQARADDIVSRVRRWGRAVSEARGYEVTIREEHLPHALITDLDDQRQIEARRRFADYAWVHIDHGVRRRYNEHPSMGHILGRMGAVDDADLESDPLADDELARLLPTERVGITGVEWAAERRLRGRRGVLQHNRRGAVVRHAAPTAGEDVSLTLDFVLQTELYALMERRLPELAPDSPGGSLVVVDTVRREVLAMISCPGYDANTFRERYNELRDDTKSTPLRFRAVANGYEPGSIIKPLTCLAGLGCGVIDVDSTIHCDGYYDRERYPNSYRCWKVTGTDQRKAHGDIDVAAAVAGSCNVFMYSVADRLGPDRLCQYFAMAGMGEETGLGLLEEREGINPTPSWLMDRRGQPATRGHARNYAIGQGEVIVTPVQAANIMAFYATGRRTPLRLMRDANVRPTWTTPVKPRAWRAIREGLFRVTNDPHGTAHHTAHWTNDRYALCGKTGSATTFPRPTHYRVRYRDADGLERFEIVPAKIKREAIDAFEREHPDAEYDSDADVEVALVWPPPKPEGEDDRHSHAWFAGYLQPIGEDGSPLLERTPPVAFAVMVEFGGSGGYTTGPLAKDISAVICDMLGPDIEATLANGEGGA